MITLEELEVYKIAIDLGEAVWKIVDKWPHFAKDTLGKQFVKSSDSIGFNIAEGYGRYFYKENKLFCYCSRGSAKEALTAARKAENRDLLSKEDAEIIKKKMTRFFILLAGYIKSIGTTSD